jgi:hypothetical protein
LRDHHRAALRGGLPRHQLTTEGEEDALRVAGQQEAEVGVAGVHHELQGGTLGTQQVFLKAVRDGEHAAQCSALQGVGHRLVLVGQGDDAELLRG